MIKYIVPETPTLTGKDAEKLIRDIKRKPTEKALIRMKRARMALNSGRKLL